MIEQNEQIDPLLLVSQKLITDLFLVLNAIYIIEFLGLLA